MITGEKDFMLRVGEMRDAQKRRSLTKGYVDILRAGRLEKEVDDFILILEAGREPQRQGELFVEANHD
ncbi:MAG: hypothetical protein LBI86_00200 [Treponema sp.]|jgi:hypothetical protein|nr:hypothetical protein [Treponema sp.]